LFYEYYEFSGSISQLPDFDSLTPLETGISTIGPDLDVSSFTLANGDDDELYAYRFSGQINISTEGAYTFFTESDDGSKLYIDGVEVVDNDGLHSMNEEEGEISLTAGLHDIVITFFENTGGDNLTVSYQGPDMSIQGEIPNSAYFQPAAVGPDFVSINSNNDGVLDGDDPLTTGNDRVVGGDTTDDTIDGLDGDDQIFGLGGIDTLLGNDGDDILFGGEGDDSLTGGAGDDSLTGGAGEDIFVFNSADGSGSTDTITDFSLTEGDVLNFADFLQDESDTGVVLANYLNVNFDNATGNSTITVDSDGTGGYTDLTVVIQGVDLSALGIDQAAILQSLIDSNNLTVDQ
jgi:Ca2+-binding RTX toxin-like protein